MRYLLGFILGVSVASYANLFAQDFGAVFDQQAKGYQYYQFPNGATNYWGTDGQMGTIYHTPGLQQRHNPC